MKKLLLFILFLFIGIVLGGVYYVWKSYRINNDIIQAKNEPVFLIEKAPKNSEKGIIKSMSGEIKWQSRVATEASQIKKPISIQQGEELISGKDGSAVIYYQRGLTISLSPNSRISFVQMLPTNFVFSQLKGEVEYQKESLTPLAIRSLHLLTQMDDENGDIQMAVDEKTAKIDLIIKKGSARIAFNDENNLSNVVIIQEGDHYQFDDKMREGSLQ